MNPPPLPKRNAWQCLFCSRRKCFHRIYTEDLAFDEVACPNHQRALEEHADRELGSPGKTRTNLASSEPVKRGRLPLRQPTKTT